MTDVKLAICLIINEANTPCRISSPESPPQNPTDPAISGHRCGSRYCNASILLPPVTWESRQTLSWGVSCLHRLCSWMVLRTRFWKRLRLTLSTFTLWELKDPQRDTGGSGKGAQTFLEMGGGAAPCSSLYSAAATWPLPSAIVLPWRAHFLPPSAKNTLFFGVVSDILFLCDNCH